MQTILLVEDALDYKALVTRTLSRYHVVTTDDPEQVLPLLEEHDVALILLDITLPKRDGYSVLQELQGHASFQHIPVMCLTGKKEITDKVTAFSLGADDYLQKPFDPLELRARVDAKVAKSSRKKEADTRMPLGNLVLDTLSHRLYQTGTQQDISLTQTEYKLLHHMGRRPGQTYSREQLLAAVWGDEGAVFDRAVDVHVCALRKKLSDHGLVFRSVPGVGYRLEVVRTTSARARLGASPPPCS